MAMNQCIECERWFKETKIYTCICPTCKDELEAKRKAESEDVSWKELNAKINGG